MASKKESLTQCQICLEYMADHTPRALTCLHTFCHDCLCKLPLRETKYVCDDCRSDITKNKTHPNRRHKYCDSCSGWTIPITQIVNLVCCPTCRNNTVLPPDGVMGLPHNFLMKHIKDAQLTDKAPPNCQSCDVNAATFFCKTCTYYLCEKCKEKHSSLNLFKSHDVRTLDVSHLCAVHGLEANYFCSKCVARICTTCIMSDLHKDHLDTLENYSDWLVNKQNKLEKTTSTLKTNFLFAKKMFKQMECYQKNTYDVMDTIKQSAIRMSEAIRNQAQAMEEILTQSANRRKYAIDTMGKFCKDCEILSESCDQLREDQDVLAVVEAEIKAITLQKSAKSLPELGKETWFKFTPGPIASLGELKEDEKELTTDKTS